MVSLKRILVPTDFSEESQRAYQWAIRLASGSPAATIVLMSVPVLKPVVAALNLDQGLDQSEHLARETMADWERLSPASMKVEMVVGHLPMGEDILKVCEAEKIDLVVVTSHSQTGVGRFLHPTMTESLIQHATCPVLVLNTTPQA